VERFGTSRRREAFEAGMMEPTKEARRGEESAAGPVGSGKSTLMPVIYF
jgi:hypothetical protein